MKIDSRRHIKSRLDKFYYFDFLSILCVCVTLLQMKTDDLMQAFDSIFIRLKVNGWYKKKAFTLRAITQVKSKYQNRNYISSLLRHINKMIHKSANK